MSGNLNMNNNRIYNVAQPNGDNQPATKIWSENKFLDKSSGVMAGLRSMANNKITNLASPTANGDAVDVVFFNKYVPSGRRDNNGNFESGGKLLYNIGQTGWPPEAITLQTANSKYLWITGRKAMTGDLNMENKKITNLADPTNTTDGVNKQYLEKSHV